jgi:hypothetical protein
LKHAVFHSETEGAVDADARCPHGVSKALIFMAIGALFPNGTILDNSPFMQLTAQFEGTRQNAHG